MENNNQAFNEELANIREAILKATEHPQPYAIIRLLNTAYNLLGTIQLLAADRGEQ